MIVRIKKGGIKKSPIKKIFHGNYQITYSCICEDKYPKFEEFNHLSLYPQTTHGCYGNKFYKLEDMLSVKCSSPEYPYKIICDVCKERITKTITISELPPVLILKIDRLSYDCTKIIDKVKFPLKLDMNEFVPGSDKDKDKIAKYSLYAICDHIGKYIKIGHYEAMCKNVNGDVWYRFNDQICNEIKKGPNVNSDEACLLFHSNSERSDYKDKILNPTNLQL